METERKAGRAWRWAIGVAVVAAVVLALAAERRETGGGEQSYIYEDTRQLVRFVEEAAALIETRGVDAFEAFAAKDSRWRDESRYVFVYTVDGTCVFHPVTPELVGKNLIGLRDMSGRLMIARIVSVGRGGPPNAGGWAFYHWQDRTELTPSWKMSYVRKAVTPDGRVFVVGCGLHTLKIEPCFVRSEVDAAAEMLKARGKEEAFAVLREPASPFYFLDTYVFVLDENGRCLVDPAFPSLSNRDMMRFRDAVGRSVVAEALKRLRKTDSTWAQYLMPKPGVAAPSRKMMYLRKVTVDGETFIVGATAFMATPIWMKL